MSKLDFAAIKNAVSMQEVIDFLGLTITKWDNENQARCSCPSCKKGGDRVLSINTEKKLFTCFGTKPFARGDLIAFVAHVKAIGMKDAAVLLNEHFMSKPTKAKKTVSRTAANDNDTADEPDYDDALAAFIKRLE